MADVKQGAAPSWAEVTHGIVRRFEVAAATGNSATWNAEGSAACAKIIKKMAAIIDKEIERRTAIRQGEPG